MSLLKGQVPLILAQTVTLFIQVLLSFREAQFQRLSFDIFLLVVSSCDRNKHPWDYLLAKEESYLNGIAGVLEERFLYRFVKGPLRPISSKGPVTFSP